MVLSTGEPFIIHFTLLLYTIQIVLNKCLRALFILLAKQKKKKRTF